MSESIDLDLHFPALPVRREGQLWAACGEGKCSCGQIWDLEGDSPILKVLSKHEEEGVTYPPELVERNALLAEAAPELLAMVELLSGEACDNVYPDAPKADCGRCDFCKARVLTRRLRKP